MQSTICLIIMLLILNSCEQQSYHTEKGINLYSLDKINTKIWDKDSQDLLNLARERSVEKLNYSQQKHLLEILITHDHSAFAIALFEKLTIKKSQYMNFLMASAYYENAQPQKALQTLDGITSNLINDAIWHLKFKILLEIGQAEAIISINTLPNKNIVFNNTLSIYYLAMAYLQNKDCQNAIPLFLQVINDQPLASSVYVPLTNAYRECKLIKEAQNAASHIGQAPLSNNQDFPNRMFKNGNPGRYYKQILDDALINNNLTTVVEATEKLIFLNVTTPKMLTNLAIIRYKSGQLNQANEALKLSLQKDPKHIKSYELMYEFNKTHDKAVAQKAIDTLLTMQPANKTYKNARNLLMKNSQNP